VRFMRQDVTDLNAKLNKLDAKIVDLDNAVKACQTPPPPPPGLGNAALTGPPPGVTAESLYRDAYRDKLGGNNDLALRQFQDYVNWYKDTANACIAQYYIGEIYFAKGDFEPSVQAFDAVLEKFPEECAKVPDAHYQKGLALAKLGQRTSAGEEFRELKRKYPTGPWTVKANAELKNLGLSTTAPPSASKKKK
jgi:TolA-binding protein